VAPQAGLDCVQEAVALYEGLAQQLPAVSGQQWAAAQATRGQLLDVLGRADEAAEVRRLLEPDGE
jgi:hypothetical protein